MKLARKDGSGFRRVIRVTGSADVFDLMTFLHRQAQISWDTAEQYEWTMSREEREGLDVAAMRGGGTTFTVLANNKTIESSFKHVRIRVLEEENEYA